MRKLTSYLLILSSLILLNSCGIMFQRYHDYMHSWIGHEEDEVYLIYGPPMRSQVLKDGTKLIAYNYSSSGTDTPTFCEINFTIKNEKVFNAKFTGDYGAVSDHVKGPKNETQNPDIKTEASN